MSARYHPQALRETALEIRAAVALMSSMGRNARRAIHQPPTAQGLYTNEVTLPELLASTHRTASFGKWHLGGGATGPGVVVGWSHFAGSLQGGLGMNATNFWLWTKTTNGTSRANYSGYATTDNVNDALAWLGAQGTNRWFLWLGFNAPYTPYHLPPTNLCPHYAGLSGSATDLQQNPRRYFEAAVEAMDTELGRLLAGVNTNETTILFLGDKSGADTALCTHWNNQTTGIVNDEVFELKMEPSNWGEITFAP